MQSLITRGIRSRVPIVNHFELCRRFSALARPAIEQLTVDPQNAEYVRVDWSDGTQSLYPSIYLRDNCTQTKTPNGQRMFETHQLEDTQLKISEYQMDETANALRVKWNDESVNTFSSDWLFENSCNKTHRSRRKQQLTHDMVYWDSSFQLKPLCSFKDIKRELISIYNELRRCGTCLVSDGPIQEMYDEHDDPPVINVGNTLGFVRETNYGKYFDVRTGPKEDPNHLAYTNAALSCHTDNPYRDSPPGIQLLHCLKQAAPMNSNDGMTKLIDGYRIAMEMKAHYKAEYELLTTIKRPFTYFDPKNGLTFHKEQFVISVDTSGNVDGIRFNNRSASCINWDIEESMIEPYYKAWILFGKLMDDPRFAYQHRLEPGNILIFDNSRILHGRNGYVAETSRHLQGCYADCDTPWARLDAALDVRMTKKAFC